VGRIWGSGHRTKQVYGAHVFEGKIWLQQKYGRWDNRLRAWTVSLQIHLWRFALYVQVCSDPAPMHCLTGCGKISSPLFSALLQNRLTSGLCHCNHTYGDLLFIQVCSEITKLHCPTGFGKMSFPLFSAALQNRLRAWTVSLQLHLWRFALLVQVCSDPVPTHCLTGYGKMSSPLFSALLENRLRACTVSLQIHL